MTPADARLLAEVVRWARMQWHAGLVKRPIGVDETRLARLEYRLSQPVADVGQSVPITGPHAEQWVTVTEGSMRTGVPRRTLTAWASAGRVRSRKVGTGSRAPHLIALADIEQQHERRTA